MRAIINTLKSLFIALGLTVILLACAFYTHPNYMLDLGSVYVPQLKQSNLYREPLPCMESPETAPSLNDRFRDYIWNSAYQKFGEPLKTKEEIRALYLKKKLFLIEETDQFWVDTLYHSFAFLNQDARQLLYDISARFQYKLRNTTLAGSRLIVTSLLRTLRSVRKLSRVNSNALKISSHLHGTTFDLAHSEFDHKDTLKADQINYLREILAQTLQEFRNGKRCFVTYEVRQACFHVVNRKD